MVKTIYRPEYRLLVEHLRALREERGLAQVVLARSLGWPQQRVSQIESGARRLDVMEFMELAGQLKLSHQDAFALIERCFSQR